MLGTETNGIVILDFAQGIDATNSRARISALLFNASLGSDTVRIDYTLWSTVGWTAKVGW